LANTFTGLQTVNGDLKADHVLVKITAPTLNTHLTSKLYVDTALTGKQNSLTSGTGIDITDNVISSTAVAEFKPVFSCRPLTVQIITQYETINWADVLYDNTNGAFESSTGTFTASIAGVYNFALRILLNKTATSVALRYNDFTTNALINALDYPKTLNTGFATLQVNLTIPMNVGQSIYPTVETAGTVSINVGQWCSFSGIFIKAL
jgi:hypothetical protein